MAYHFFIETVYKRGLAGLRGVLPSFLSSRRTRRVLEPQPAVPAWMEAGVTDTGVRMIITRETIQIRGQLDQE